MSSPTVSTASVTTACWQVHGARSTLQRLGYYSARNLPNRMTHQQPRSSRSHFANHARTAAGRCASSRRFAEVSAHQPAHHRESGPHDGKPANLQKLHPGTQGVSGRYRFATCRAQSVRRARNDSKSFRSAPEMRTTAHPHDRFYTSPATADATDTHNPNHSFPIGSAKLTRLPSWEDFQRGPQSVHAGISHPGPRRKSFTRPAVDDRTKVRQRGRQTERLSAMKYMELFHDREIEFDQYLIGLTSE